DGAFVGRIAAGEASPRRVNLPSNNSIGATHLLHFYLSFPGCGITQSVPPTFCIFIYLSQVAENNSIGATHLLHFYLSFPGCGDPDRLVMHGRDGHATITSNNIIPIGATHHLRGLLSFAVARASRPFRVG
ncbi:MAG: hypothetical protein ACK5AM_15660, partial [Pirellulaceae bacterium]